VHESVLKCAIKNACGVRKYAQKYAKRAETCDFFQLFDSFFDFFDFFIFFEGVYADLIARVEGDKAGGSRWKKFRKFRFWGLGVMQF